MPLPDDDDDDQLSADELAQRTRALVAQVDALTGSGCVRCRRPLCGHGALLAIVLGLRHQPHCATCAAASMGEDPASLAERGLQWITRRDCFRHVWLRASAAEGFAAHERPACHFADAAPFVSAATATTSDAPAADARWDAGDLGCGELVLELRFKLLELPPGGIIAVTARDPAAPVDLPAWCGLCGHSLLHARHPDYFIQRKRN
jgi:tRNA 2-thiouridine synthesizing protein A